MLATQVQILFPILTVFLALDIKLNIIKGLFPENEYLEFIVHNSRE